MCRYYTLSYLIGLSEVGLGSGVGRVPDGGCCVRKGTGDLTGRLLAVHRLVGVVHLVGSNRRRVLSNELGSCSQLSAVVSSYYVGNCVVSPEIYNK